MFRQSMSTLCTWESQDVYDMPAGNCRTAFTIRFLVPASCRLMFRPHVSKENCHAIT